MSMPSSGFRNAFNIDPGLGRMVVASLVLHLLLVALLAGNMFRLHQPLHPITYIDLANLPVYDLPVVPPLVEPEAQEPITLPAEPPPPPSPPPTPVAEQLTPQPAPVPAPVPVPAPKPETKSVAKPTPPPPTPAVPRQEIPLPRPARRAYTEPRPENRPALPERGARVETTVEAELEVRPALPSYDRPAAQSAASLPQESTQLRSLKEQAELAAPTAPIRRDRQDRPAVNQPLPAPAAVALAPPSDAEVVTIDPALRPLRERAPASTSLPSPAAVALAAPPDRSAPVAIVPDPAGEKYEPRRSTTSPAELPVQTRVEPRRASDPTIVAPASRGTVPPPRREDSPAPSLPASSTLTVARAESPEVALSRPQASPRPTPKPAEDGSLPGSRGDSFHFLDAMAPTDLDPSRLVSLNKLHTCRNPEAENQLKTRLATLLSRPQRCRSGGVVFDVRQPDSAWSIHIDLYNYEQREFQDRCDALQLAVACFEQSRR